MWERSGNVGAPRNLETLVRSAVVVHAGGDYRGNRDDATAFADLQTNRVEPRIGPIAFGPTFQERACALVNLFACLGNLVLRDATQNEVHRSCALWMYGDPHCETVKRSTARGRAG
jgi:hypothetical protein